MNKVAINIQVKKKIQVNLLNSGYFIVIRTQYDIHTFDKILNVCY